MTDSSQHQLIKNKNILVIGAGGISKRYVWTTAVKHGVRTYLVDELSCDPVAKASVTAHIKYDITDHKRDEEHAINIVRLIHDLGVTIDGCCTFRDESVILVALTSEFLKLTSPGLAGARNAKTKSRTHQVLLSSPANTYASKSVSLTCVDDIPAAIDQIGLPAMMKLEHGSEGVGARLVRDAQDAIKEFQHITTRVQHESDLPGMSLGNQMMLMEYIDGPDFDIDLIIFNRKLVTGIVTDNAKHRPGSFTDTAVCLPSCLPKYKQLQLISAAYDCCLEIGLVNGVISVELRWTRCGPKLIEINARMGGFYVSNWVNACYNIDLVLCTFLIACGVEPIVSVSEPLCQIVGVNCIPSVHANVLADPGIQSVLEKLCQQGILRVTQYLHADSSTDANFERITHTIAAVGKDVEESKATLISITEKLGFSTPEYNVVDFLSDFTKK